MLCGSGPVSRTQTCERQSLADAVGELFDARRAWYVGAIARSQTADPEFPRVTIHDLRHTAASLAISAGANVKAVQRMLGHSSAAMTLDTYAKRPGSQCLQGIPGRSNGGTGGI